MIKIGRESFGSGWRLGGICLCKGVNEEPTELEMKTSITDGNYIEIDCKCPTCKKIFNLWLELTLEVSK